MFLFANNTSGELILAKPNHQGISRVPKNGTFIGDSYYLSMAQQGQLRVVESIQKEEKLLTEQPPVVTTSGVVEYVRSSERANLQETGSPRPDVLMTDAPLDGIRLVK